MKTPQVPAIPGMTPLGLPEKANKPKPPKPPRKPTRKRATVKPPKARFAPSIIPERALAHCAVLGLTTGSCGELARDLMRRNPYVMAQRLFVAGHLLQGQAAALAATDGDFQAECRYQHKDAREEATRIVRDVWSRDLVANMTSGRSR